MFRFAKVTALTMMLCSTGLAAQGEARGNYRSLEESLMDAEATRSITADQLQSLPLNAPLLRLAYSEVFLGAINDQFDAKDMLPQCIVALTDMRRRGETVVPLLLDMLEKNQDTPLEGGLVQFAPGIKTFDIAPFMEYARVAIRSRALTLNSSNGGSMAALLASHGTEPDLSLLKWFAETRPYLTATLSPEISHLEQRLVSSVAASNPARASSHDKKDKSATSGTRDPGPMPRQSEPVTSTPWSIIVVLIVAACGLLWLLLKRRS
jgi:hypothetical protein